MMPDDSTSGEIYGDNVGKWLEAEYERRKILEARGESIIKTSSGIIALILGLAVFISGKDYKFSNHWGSVWILLASLAAFILSAGVAIYVQSWGLTQMFPGKAMLERLTQEFWDMAPEDAQRMCLQRNVNSTLSLREGNDKKASAAQYSVVLQFSAIALLSVSLVFELTGKH